MKDKDWQKAKKQIIIFSIPFIGGIFYLLFLGEKLRIGGEIDWWDISDNAFFLTIFFWFYHLLSYPIFYYIVKHLYP